MRSRQLLQRLPATIHYTEEGYQKVKDEFEKLTEKRKGAVISLRTAREMGDLSENGAYKAARFELTTIDRQLRRLTFLIRFGKVTATQHTGMVGFGNLVTIKSGKSEMSFMLVDGYESNPKEQKLSVHSPIGKAVLGKRIGDTVLVTAPKGQTEYLITAIE